MTKAEILAINLCQTGYGAIKESILPILNKLTDDEIETLTYNLFRTAEKCGPDAFDCRGIFKG